MAELILTPEEIAANDWLDLDDAALGKLVKAQALRFQTKAEELGRTYPVAAAMLLADNATSLNMQPGQTHTMRFELTKSDEYVGTFAVEVTRLADHEPIE